MLLHISRREQRYLLKLKNLASVCTSPKFLRVCVCESIFFTSLDALYLWGMISTDDRAEDVVNKEPQGITSPPGSALVGQIPDGSQDLLQGAVVCQRDAHPEWGGGEGGGVSWQSANPKT